MDRELTQWPSGANGYLPFNGDAAFLKQFQQMRWPFLEIACKEPESFMVAAAILLAYQSSPVNIVPQTEHHPGGWLRKSCNSSEQK